jgi:hypothetical protein|tara:strand:+ start:25 stop:714 length:690 start_codon:yes stop_codon:yes gene_type:complete
MKKGFGFIILCITCLLGFGQDENGLQQPDIPGDIMLDFGFNSLMDNKQLINTELFPSHSIGIYYMAKRKLSDQFIFNPAIGLTFEKIGFSDRSNYQVDDLKITSWDTVSVGDLRSNRLAITYLELPLELRFYPNQTVDGEGLFVSIGGVLGFKIAAKTKMKYKLDGSKFKETNTGNFGLSDVRYGIVARLGFEKVNAFVKYYMSDVWHNAPIDQATPSQFTFGLNLTGF